LATKACADPAIGGTEYAKATKRNTEELYCGHPAGLSILDLKRGVFK
jgi:hypothetical protein